MSKAIPLVLLALLLSACGATTEDDPSPSAARVTTEQDTPDQNTSEQAEADEIPTEDFTEPEVEDTGGVEEPEPAVAEGVAVELAGLPIGGNTSVDEANPRVRCAEVNWTGPPDTLPAAVNLEITEMGTTPAGIYAISDGSCSNGLPPCLFSPGVLGSAPCGVLIEQIAASPDDFGELFVSSGAISCAPGEEWVCEQFVADLAQNTDPARIEWFDALTDWGVTTDTSETTG